MHAQQQWTLSTENNENFTQKCGISKIICDTTCRGVQKTQTGLKTKTTDRPQTQKTQPQKTQTSKTQTSQFKVSLKTYTFDGNSLLMALIFPIVYGLAGMPTLLFFFFCCLTFIYIYCWTGNENRQQSNAGFLCWSRIYDCVMCHDVFNVVQSLFITQ